MRSLRLPLGLAALALPVFAARSARAEQFVLVDATFDYTWDDAVNAKPSKSHFYVNDKNFLNVQRPKNWVTPVDYRNGTLHVRVEVLKKPAGEQQLGWTLCYIANAGDYGCADSSYYQSTGVFERDTKMTDFWQNEKIEWEQGIKQIDLVYTIDDSGSGHVTNYPELKDLTTPTRVRVTMVQVSAGAKYDSSVLSMGGMGGSGAGGSGGTGGAVAGAGGLGEGAGGNGGVAGSGDTGGLGLGGMSGTASAPVTTPSGSPAANGGGPVVTSPATPHQEPTTDAGCSVTSASRGVSGVAAAVALLSALALLRRLRDVLSR